MNPNYDGASLVPYVRPSDFHGIFTSQHAKAGHGSRHRAASASVALYLLSDSVEYRAFTNVSNHAAVIFPSLLPWQAARTLQLPNERSGTSPSNEAYFITQISCPLLFRSSQDKEGAYIAPSFPSQDNDQAS